MNGIVNNELLNIFIIISPNCVMFSALKIIQPKTTNVKVTSIWRDSLRDGKSFVFVVPSGKVVVATVSR